MHGAYPLSNKKLYDIFQGKSCDTKRKISFQWSIMYLIMQSYNELPISSKIIINFRFSRRVVLKYFEKI